jgi:concanavalin A-like lectin/glucanase superfamily protein
MRKMIASVAVLGLIPCALYADVVGPTIGYWRFEEGAANTTASGDNSVLDSSGNGMHGTPVLGPVYRSDVPPSFPGNSLSMEFDGSTGHRVVVPDNPIFELTHSLTLEAFIKAQPMKPGTGGGADIVFRSDNRPGLDPYRLTLKQPGDTLVFAIVDENQNYADVQAQIPYDTWLHVAGTLDDATGTMKLFINGSQVASTLTSIRPLGPLESFWGAAVSIGEDPTGQYGEAFNGLIDEVRISNVALEPSEFLIPEPSLAFTVLPLALGLYSRRRRQELRRPVRTPVSTPVHREAVSSGFQRRS